MKSTERFLAFLLVTIWSLVCCQSTQTQQSCESFFGSGFVSPSFEETNRSAFIDWITKAFKLTNAQIEVTDLSVGSDVNWESKGASYRATFGEDGTLFRVSTNWLKLGKPSLETVLKCFGTPTSYNALLLPSMSGNSRVEFNAIYAKQGMVFGASLDNASSIPLNVGLDLFFAKPGRDEQVINNVYPYDSSGVFKRSLAPWPTDIQNIKIVKGTP